MPFGGEEEEEKEEEKVLCARFKVLFYIEYLWHTYLHKCTVLVTTAEFFANKTSLFFSRLARVFLSNRRKKKRFPFSSLLVSTLFPKSFLFHDFTEY